MSEQQTKEDRLCERVVVLYGAAHPCTVALAEKIERLLSERDELKRDVARIASSGSGRCRRERTPLKILE